MCLFWAEGSTRRVPRCHTSLSVQKFKIGVFKFGNVIKFDYLCTTSLR
nr:MAG TPA: hypothetical protein [Caudoviricetes sp.]